MTNAADHSASVLLAHNNLLKIAVTLGNIVEPLYDLDFRVRRGDAALTVRYGSNFGQPAKFSVLCYWAGCGDRDAATSLAFATDMLAIANTATVLEAVISTVNATVCA